MGKRSLPIRKTIYTYWENSPLKIVLNKQAFDKNNNKCMACGVEANIDRAHIVSKFYGGSNEPSNIHCLCQICHKLSENLQGHDYWLWIALKSKLFSYGTDMTYELDHTSSKDKSLRPYYMEFEYPEKLRKYSKEYTQLSLLEGWGGRSTICYLYLAGLMPNSYLDINYPLLSDIEEILEYNSEIHFYIPEIKRRWNYEGM